MTFDCVNNEVRGPERDKPRLPEGQTKKLLDALSPKRSVYTAEGIAKRTLRSKHGKSGADWSADSSRDSTIGTFQHAI